VVPDAVISCTTSSGTSFDAATTSSCVAGHVSTWPISSSRSPDTPDDLHDVRLLTQILGHEQPSRVEGGVAVVVHGSTTTSWGRSMSSNMPAGLARPSAQRRDRGRVVRG